MARKTVKRFNPQARLAQKDANRRRDAVNVATGRTTERELHERNAVRWEGLDVNLPRLAKLKKSDPLRRARRTRNR